MVLNGLSHVGFEEIITDLIGMLEHEPAPRPIDWKNAYFLSTVLDERRNLLCRKLQELL
jgi:hypothetical protein